MITYHLFPRGKIMRKTTILIAGLLLSLVMMQACAATTISIDDCRSAPDNSVTVPIIINGVENYGAGTINIAYDPAVVHVTGVTNSSDSIIKVHNEDNSAGITSVSAWNINGVNGDIVFADVTLRAIGSSGDSSPLTLNVIKLVDTTLSTIPSDQNDGIFEISGNAEGEATVNTPTIPLDSTKHSVPHPTPPLPGVVTTAEPGSGGEPLDGQNEPAKETETIEETETAEETDTSYTENDVESQETQTPSQKTPGLGIGLICLSFMLACMILRLDT